MPTQCMKKLQWLGFILLHQNNSTIVDCSLPDNYPQLPAIFIGSISDFPDHATFRGKGAKHSPGRANFGVISLTVSACIYVDHKMSRLGRGSRWDYTPLPLTWEFLPKLVL